MMLTVSSYGSSKLMIIVDLSGSMGGEVNGISKIGLAQKVLIDTLSRLPEKSVVGMQVMGSKRRKGCSNTSLVVSPSIDPYSKILSYVKNANLRGKSPMAKALKMATISMQKSAISKLLIISDGEESCGYDTCKIAKDLKLEYAALQINSVSLAIDKESDERMSCIAKVTGGKYTKANEKIVSQKNTPIKMIEKTVAAEEVLFMTPKVKIFSVLPDSGMEDSVKHKVYKRDGELVFECVSTYNKECIKEISAGKYIVESDYKGKIQKTKLHILKNADAFLYTSFKTNRSSSDEQYVSAEETPEPEEAAEPAEAVEDEKSILARVFRGREKKFKRDSRMADDEKLREIEEKMIEEQRSLIEERMTEEQQARIENQVPAESR